LSAPIFDDVAAELLPGELERGSGARRALEEAVDDRAPAQQAALIVGLPVQFDIAVGKIEELVDVVGRETLDPEQMTAPGPGIKGTFWHKTETNGAVVKSQPGRRNQPKWSKIHFRHCSNAPRVTSPVDATSFSGARSLNAAVVGSMADGPHGRPKTGTQIWISKNTPIGQRDFCNPPKAWHSAAVISA
jgi:hypothetical protein